MLNSLEEWHTYNQAEVQHMLNTQFYTLNQQALITVKRIIEYVKSHKGYLMLVMI